ncbi:putative ribonuclease H-like domain-containing protein [Tanacetum coccineum]|uniref:Ribonuclease H-like domain-containing protein n=1 Tax=Tanacetum coccineum TaxID=301880 RepID=A0ABQ5IT34_9ASTR
MHDSLLNDIVLHLLVMLISLRLSYWSKVKVIRCDNGTEFKNKEMNQFYDMKGILRQYSVARTPQQNGVAEKRNKTLIKAARTMLADSKLPTTFWAKAVNTACYVQNRVSQDDRSKPSSDDGKKVDEDSRKDSEGIDQEKENNVNSTNNVNVASTNKVNAIGEKTSIELPLDPNMPELEDYSIFEDDEDVSAEVDMHNLDTTI